MSRLFRGGCIGLIIMSFISSLGISSSFEDTFLIVILSSWAPVLLAFIFDVAGKKNVAVQYVTASAFVSVSGVAFFYLFITTYQVLTIGPLNEAGMIFAFLPFVYIKFAFLGALFGGIVYLAMRTFGKNA